MAVRIMTPTLLAHLLDVDRAGRSRAQSFMRLRALGDVGGLVADALQVAIDLDDGEDEAQVDGHRLLLGEQLVGHLVDRWSRRR